MPTGENIMESMSDIDTKNLFELQKYQLLYKQASDTIIGNDTEIAYLKRRVDELRAVIIDLEGESVETKRDKTSDISVSIPEDLVGNRGLHLEIFFNGKGI